MFIQAGDQQFRQKSRRNTRGSCWRRPDSVIASAGEEATVSPPDTDTCLPRDDAEWEMPGKGVELGRVHQNKLGYTFSIIDTEG